MKETCQIKSKTHTIVRKIIKYMLGSYKIK